MAIQLGHNRPGNFLFLTRQRLGSQHQIFESESYYTIRLSGPELLEENHSHFDEDIKGILISNKHCIVHLIGFKSIPRGNWLKSLIGLVRELESDGRFCRFIGLSKDLRLQFREQGIDGVLRASNGLAHALEEMGLSAKHSIDVDFVNPFMNSNISKFII